MLPVTFLTNSAIPDARLIYKAQDYYMVTEPTPLPTDKKWVLSIDTLSFLVSPNTKLFLGLDCYAPSTAWITSKSLHVPKETAVGVMKLEVSFEDGMARLAQAREVVSYHADREHSLLLVQIGKGVASRYVRFGSEIIGGIDEESRLTEIWCLHVKGLK